MPKMVLSIDGVVIKEVPLTKQRTTLGRRPFNDVMIDNLAVSGEHAAVSLSGEQIFVEDLNSTNGTYVNGRAVKKQMLADGDVIEVGKYKIRLVSGLGGVEYGSTQPYSATDRALAGHTPKSQAKLRVLSGSAAGREVPLTKAVTTVGKPGVAIASITRRNNGFLVSHVEGNSAPILNGTPVGKDAITLKSGDLIELSGIQMQIVMG